MSVGPKIETKDDSITDDLERFIATASESDPRFKDALEDAEVLQRLLDCLTSLRRDRNLSQTEVAHRMGVRQPTVCGFEKASSDPKFSTLQRYARAIDARLRIVVETSHNRQWVSPSTCVYAREATAPPRASRSQRDQGLVPAWASSRTSSNTAAIA